MVQESTKLEKENDLESRKVYISWIFLTENGFLIIFASGKRVWNILRLTCIRDMAVNNHFN